MKKLFIVLNIILFLIALARIYVYFCIKPTINLIGNENVTILYGNEYEELGSSAFILDKDFSFDIVIKSNVDTTKLGEYVVEYSISNKYLKNSSSIKRKVKVIDEEKPILTLEGNKKLKYYVGSKYKESGYSAFDNYDGDITTNVEIDNKVDFSKPGEYTITYTVSDSSGNTVSDTRNVTIVKKPVVNRTTNKGTGRGIAILMYHYFYDETKGETGKNSNYMKVSDFEEQMKYLHDNNYYFPTWDEVADFIDGKKTLPTKSVVVTIDDGQKSTFDYAYPILTKYNIKATAFIITSNNTRFKNYLGGVLEFQSHTHNMHKGGCSGGHGGLFRCIDYNKGIADLKESISILGKNDVIAYPYGDVTDNVLKITKDSGFKVGLTTVNARAKKGMDRYRLPRVRMYKDISLKAFINSI